MSVSTCVTLTFLSVIYVINSKPRIVNLSGEPDFRGVTLRWQVAPDGDTVTGRFRVKYCENQIWGEHYCRYKPVKQKPTQEQFSTDILGLKMSTNYTFYLETDVLEKSSRKERKIEQNLVLQTKGFSARATGCRRDTTEVLLETGPHFGGKISAEGRESNCFIKGNEASSNSSYSFTIDHKECGSSMNKTSVWTYVVVQENLPILTHSTRRFLVLCHFTMPEVFKVTAGFNLPGGNSRGVGSGSLQPVDISELGSREGRRYSDIEYDDLSSKIITAASLEEARLARMLTSPRHSASQRQSRTLASNLFGALDFGDRDQRADPASHNLWMILLIVSAGAVVLTVCGMLVACKPRGDNSDCDNVSSDDIEESNAASQVIKDTQALQPKRKDKPRESRA